MSDEPTAEVFEHLSPLPFPATVQRLEEAIAQAGLMLFSRIDHQAGARQAGLDMPPATVLTYGHAKGGTPIMLATPLAALDLPLRVLVHEREDGQTAIAFHPMGAVLRRAGVPEALAGRLDPAQLLLLKALAA